MGRTHGVHAEPTTFGLKLAGWAFELDRDRAARRPRARGDARRKALGRGRHVCGHRSGARAHRLRAARPRAGADLDADPSARPARRAADGARDRRRRRSTSSRSRSGTLRAPRWPRCRSRSARGRRARRRCRTSGTRSSRSASAGSRASSARAARRRPRERRALARARHLALVGRARRHPRCLPRARLHARPLHVARRRARRPRGAHAPEPRGEPLPLLQPARPARARRVRSLARRGVPARAAQRDARVGRGARLPRARPPRRRDRVAHRSRTVFDLDAYTRHVDTVFSPSSTHSPPRRSPFMSEATHVASGKVREIYALDDDRLLLVASDRISTFDVVLPTEIPDKGRVLTGLSGFWFTLLHAIVPNHMLAIRDDARSMECKRLEMLPDRVRRARLPRRLGLEGLPGDGRDLRPHAAGGPARVRQAAGADLHAGDEGADGPRREHHARRRRQSSSAPSASPRSSASASRSTATRRESRARRAGSSSPTRSSSSATTPTATLVLGDEALTPDSSRFWPADTYEPGRAQDSFDKQFVRDYCEQHRLGQDDPGPGAPGGRRHAHALEVHRGVRAADDDPVRVVPREPDRGARVKATVLVRPKAGHSRPAGRGGRERARASRLLGLGRARRQGGRPRGRRERRGRGARAGREDVRAAAREPVDGVVRGRDPWLARSPASAS